MSRDTRLVSSRLVLVSSNPRALFTGLHLKIWLQKWSSATKWRPDWALESDFLSLNQHAYLSFRFVLIFYSRKHTESNECLDLALPGLWQAMWFKICLGADSLSEIAFICKLKCCFKICSHYGELSSTHSALQLHIPVNVVSFIWENAAWGLASALSCFSCCFTVWDFAHLSQLTLASSRLVSSRSLVSSRLALVSLSSRVPLGAALVQVCIAFRGDATTVCQIRAPYFSDAENELHCELH